MSENDNVEYPVYLIPGSVNMTIEEIQKSLSESEIVDIEVDSSDEEQSLPECDLILEAEMTIYSTIATNKIEDVSERDNENPTTKNLQKFNKQLDETIAQWKPLLKCEKCMLLCPSYTQLEEHFRLCHKNVACYILCCFRRIAHRQPIVEHILESHCDGLPKDISSKGTPVNINTQEIMDFVHHYMRDMKCDLCAFTSTSYERLKKHFRLDHPYDNFHILCCGHKFTRLYSIAEHIRVHISKSSYKCHKCSKLYFSRNDLHYHTMQDHNINLYPTTRHLNLELAAKSNTSLARTSYTDLDCFIAKWKPNLECYKCKGIFNTFTSLEIHFSQNHPGSHFLVACCGTGFKKRHQLEEHIHLHKDRFQCEICSIYFPRRSKLYDHHRNQHPLEIKREEPIATRTASIRIDNLMNVCKSQIQCGECREGFGKFTLLEKHFKARHPELSVNVYCCLQNLRHPFKIAHHILVHIKQNRKEKNRNILPANTQMEIDEFIAIWRPILECEICERAFKFYRQLKDHFADFHPGEYCHLVCCQKKLQGRVEIEKHILGHPVFRCHICKYIAYKNSDLYSHVKENHPQ
ncbi:zinc finger Y-chromosomal protein 2-like [Haematobia irritans]|uniref:zinc finger Y-chromosomal protein 2-like n=1 Tax=Haematobia irritans TaxID=7368 RepID=UPI003F4FBB4D